MKLPNELVKRVEIDFQNIDLGDPRRRDRVLATVRKLAKKPNRSVPEAMSSEAALDGAYRLVNNQSVTFKALGTEHAEATQKRANEAESVFVLHDTTTCQIGHAAAEEIGFLPTGKAGFFFIAR